MNSDAIIDEREFAMNRLTRLKIISLLLVFLAAFYLAAGCSAGGRTDVLSNPLVSGSTSGDQQNILPGKLSNLSGVNVEWTVQDLDESFSMVEAVMVTLQGGSILVEGEGAEVSGNTLIIKEAGKYIITGEMNNGQILVDAGAEDQVRLILNGLDLTSSASAPLYVRKAGAVIITLAEGTINTLTDAADYQITNNEKETEAALYSNSALTINGSGTLVIYARYRNGLVSMEELKIVNATVKVNASEVGIKGRNLVAIRNAGIAVKAGSDGILAKNEQNPKRGIVYIESGTIDIYAYARGIEAAANLIVLDGELIIESGLSSTVEEINDL